MKQQKLTANEFEKVQALKAAGMPEWKAVCQVLGISEDTNFVVNAAGTSSSPKDGLIVTFID